MNQPTLGPGTIVRWVGVSPQCSHPDETRHGFALYGVGIVAQTDVDPQGYLPGHNLMVEVESGLYCLVRPDEVGPVDEFGTPGDVEARVPVAANVAGYVSVGA
jgi:hypothetical protein